MIFLRSITIALVCFGVAGVTLAATPVETQEELAQIHALKNKLFDTLSSGDVQSGMFDKSTELDIANEEMAISQYYFSQGDRKSAVISAIIARKILQQLYGNPYDPRLIPIYSLLVQIYNSDVDIYEPGKDVSDADKAKLYREMIDHIHAR